jgi:hypothetical protein
MRVRWDAVALTVAEPVSATPSNFNRVIEYPKDSRRMKPG